MSFDIRVISPLNARGRCLSQNSQLVSTLSSDVTVSQWNSRIVSRLHVRQRENFSAFIREEKQKSDGMRGWGISSNSFTVIISEVMSFLCLICSSDFKKNSTDPAVDAMLYSINASQKSSLYLVYVWCSVARQHQHNGVFSRSRLWGL